jgi:hypothetical protein
MPSGVGTLRGLNLGIERRETRRKLWKLFIVILILTTLSDFLVYLSEWHPEFPWYFPGFATIYGFASCIFIIVFSKWIGHKWLMKDENYWDRVEGEEGGGATSLTESGKEVEK